VVSSFSDEAQVFGRSYLSACQRAEQLKTHERALIAVAVIIALPAILSLLRAPASADEAERNAHSPETWIASSCGALRERERRQAFQSGAILRRKRHSHVGDMWLFKTRLAYHCTELPGPIPLKVQ
jgi:hypothetical protein